METMKQVVEQEVMKIAAGIQASNPGMSVRDATKAALKTEKGRELYSISADPDAAYISPRQYAEKMGARAARDEKAELAQQFANAKRVTFKEGLAIVEKIAPTLCAKAAQARPFTA